MARPSDENVPENRKRQQRRAHQAGATPDYRGNSDLAGEADEPGDRVQGSDGEPVTGKP